VPTQQSEAGVDVVLISHAFWVQEFGSDPSVVGRTVDLNDDLRTIIGVLPQDLALPERETAIFVPFEIDSDNVRVGQFRWEMIGRVAEGGDPESLQAQLAPLAARLPEIHDGSPTYVSFMVDGQYRPVVRLLKEELVGELEQPLWILLGTVGFVLLIACANVANLFLVRAESRQRDMAVRAALGAGRARLVRAHLAEALVLAGLGGVPGGLLAWIGVPLLIAAAPAEIPRIDSVALDGGVLGKRLRFAADTTGWEVVIGVVEDVRDVDLREEGRGMAYFPLVGRGGDDDRFVPSPAYTIKATNASSLIPAVRDEIRRRDPSLPIYAMQTMDDIVAESVARLSFAMLALGVSAVMALILGAVGLYGVLSYLVSQRTQEIGVRLALGAEAFQVRRMVVSQGAKLALIGMLGGLVASAGLTRLLQGLLYGTEALDPATFAGMATVMMPVGLLAAYVPAQRPSSVDPLESMRSE